MVTLQSAQEVYSTQFLDTTHANNSYDGNESSAISAPLFIPCDNPRNVVSPYVAEMVDFVVYAGIFPVLVTCGVITNVINMAVFAKQGLSDRIHLCLFSLAASDTGFLLFLMGGKFFTLLGLVDPVAADFWQQRHITVVVGTYTACLSLSNIITALLALERCLCVLSPLKAAKLFKTKYMRTGIVTVAVYILTVINVSLGLKYQTVQVTDPITNTSTYITRLKPLYLRHRTLIDLLYKHTISVPLPFTSFVIVIVCTLTVVQRLKATAKWRRQTVSNMTSVEKQEVMVTRMLVTVCCIYLLCMVPNVCRAMLVLVRLPGFLMTGHLCNVFKVTIALTHLLEAVNSSVNFFIYIKQSSRYRSTLGQLCCRVISQQTKK